MACRMDTRQPTSVIHTARRMEWKRKDENKPFSGLVYPSISPCGRYVACAGDWNGSFHIWDVRAGRSEPMQVGRVGLDGTFCRAVAAGSLPAGGLHSFFVRDVPLNPVFPIIATGQASTNKRGPDMLGGCFCAVPVAWG